MKMHRTSFSHRINPALTTEQDVGLPSKDLQSSSKPKKARFRTSLKSLVLLTCSTALLLMARTAQGQQFDDTAKSTTKISNPDDQVLDIIQTTMRSSAILSDSQGSQAEGAVEHMILNGRNGLQLEMSLPVATRFNYTVMFWFRSHLSMAEITHVTSTQRFTLFELAGGAGCYVEGTSLKCNPSAPLEEDITSGEVAGGLNVARGSQFELDLRRLPDLKQWTHLTYSAVYQPQPSVQASNSQQDTAQNEPVEPKQSYAYVRLDASDFFIQAGGSFAPITGRTAYLGIDSGLTAGFKADYREFYVSLGYVDPQNVPFLMHQRKIFDVSTMAYYQFQRRDTPSYYLQDFLEDAMRNQRASVVHAQGTPSKERLDPDFAFETGAYPTCNSLPPTVKNIARFFRKEVFPTVDIPRGNQRKVRYSLSMWIKNQGGQTYSSNPRVGREKHHLIWVEEAFALWFDSMSSFRVYVYSKDRHFETYSRSVFLPLNEWVNIQVNLDYNTGITIQTYNSNGEMQQEVLNRVALGPQFPTGRMSLFESFVGVVYRVELWTSHFTLPIISDEVGTGNKVMDFIFSDNDGYWETLDEETQLPVAYGWDQQLAGTTSLSLAETKGFEFVYTKVPSKTPYNQGRLFGQLQANITQWNGISCPNPEPSQVYINGSASYIGADLAVNATDRYTVEFWFKPHIEKLAGQASQRTYLMTLTTEQNGVSEESMSIYVDSDGVLKCAPFGPSSSSENLILTFTGVKPFETNKWQHISCAFQQQKIIVGHYVAVNLKESTDLQTDLLPQTFAKSIVDTTSRTTNYVKVVRWKMLLGQNPTLSQAFYGSFKDLRLWNEVRSAFDLTAYRLKQIPIEKSTALVANFKLMDGSSVIYNSVDWFRSGIMPMYFGTNTVLINKDPENTVCAENAYFDVTNRGCTGFPFERDLPVVYSVVNNVQHGHQMILQHFSRSQMTLQGADYEPQLLSYWLSDDAQVSERFLEGRRQRNMVVFDPVFMGDGKKYNFTMNLHDERHHNFFQETDQLVIPRKCLTTVDVKTREPFNEVKLLIGPKAENTRDMCFDFEVQRIDGCYDGFKNTLSELVKIQTQPPLADEVILRVTQSYDQLNQRFTRCFKAEDVAQAMPRNQHMNFIFTVFWESSESGHKDPSYMSVVYDVLLVDHITPSLKASQTLIDLDSTVTLDASESMFTLSQKRAGLYYKWTCPSIFEDYCEQWDSSPVLAITPQLFKTLGGKEAQMYTFAVEVSSLYAGQNPTTTQTFLANTRLRWINLQKPDFQIVPPSRMLVTRDNTVNLSLNNFRKTDPNLKIEYKMEPASKVDEEKISMTGEQPVIFVNKDALKFNTQYTLTVTVTNSASSKALSETKSVKFKTATGPRAGQLIINPQQGSMLTTEFNIQLSGFSSAAQPLSYMLYGIVSKKRIKLTSQKINLVNGNGVLTLKLPFVQTVLAEITDATGEIVSTQKAVQITRDQQKPWIQIAKDIDEKVGENLLLKWQYFQFLTYQSNLDGEEKLQSVSDTQKVNSFIAQQALDDVKSIGFNDAEPEQIQIVKSILTTVVEIVDLPNFMTEEIAQDIADFLEYIQRLSAAIIDMNEDEVFRLDFVTTISSIMDYSSTQAEAIITGDEEKTQALLAQSRRRMLQNGNNDEKSDAENEALQELLREFREILKKIIVIKNKQLDFLCEIIAPSQSFRQIVPNLELHVAKISTQTSSNEINFTQSKDGTVLTLPIDELIIQSKAVDPTVEEICLQATFMKTNPVSGYRYEAQYYREDQTYTQLDSLDDKGNRLLSSPSGFRYLDLTPYEVAFKYDYPQDKFFRNQTYCLQFDGNKPNFEDQRWLPYQCEAIYQQDTENPSQNALVCRCSGIKNFYLGIVTDRSRRLEMVPVVKADWYWQLLALLIPIFVLGCACPYVMYKLDYHDYQSVEDDIYEVDDDMIEELKVRRNKVCVQEIYYDLGKIWRFTQMQSFRSGSWEAFKTYSRNCHPFFSLFMRFDYQIKRILRLSVVIAQVCLITLAILFFYAADNDEWPIFEKFADFKWFWISLFLSLLTLPVPRWVFHAVKTEIYVLSENDQHNTPGNTSQTPQSQRAIKKDQSMSQNVDGQQELAGGNHDDAAADLEMENGEDNGEMATQGGGEDQNAGEQQKTALVEYWWLHKLMFIGMVYLLWIFTFCFLVYVIIHSGHTHEDTSSMKYRVRLNRDKAREIVKCWYFAIFVWGWLCLNFLRVSIIGYLAPINAQGEFELEKQGQNAHGFWAQCSCASCLIISRDSIDITLDALTVIDIMHRRRDNPREPIPIHNTQKEAYKNRPNGGGLPSQQAMNVEMMNRNGTSSGVGGVLQNGDQVADSDRDLQGLTEREREELQPASRMAPKFANPGLKFKSQQIADDQMQQVDPNDIHVGEGSGFGVAGSRRNPAIQLGIPPQQQQVADEEEFDEFEDQRTGKKDKKAKKHKDKKKKKHHKSKKSKRDDENADDDF